MSYKLKLDVFEGPLDLLLYLIKKNDIDITDIPIVDITDQYMQYIEMMQMLDLDVVGDFLVMAATLMQIKSRMLLPPDPREEEDEELDPRDELVRRLHEYQKFKEIADDLQEKEMARKELFSRQLNEDEQNQLKEEAREVYFDANLFDLISALSHALRRVEKDPVHKITQEEFTVEEKVHDIMDSLRRDSTLVLNRVFDRCRTKMEAIVTFLAILELIRLKEIKVAQKRLFADIEIQRNSKLDEPAASAFEQVAESGTEGDADGREESSVQ